MEIDPSALSRSTTNAEPCATPSISSKALPNGKDALSSKSKTAPATPRVDLEPYYVELKSSIGDQWGEYKDAVSQFVIGYLNQVELTNRVESILQDPFLENTHNQLICGIYANLCRDVPDSLLATWVSANDKPVPVVKAPQGDAADQQLKGEIMRLPSRVRGRIKAVRDEPARPLTDHLLSYAAALSIHQPSTTSTASSLNTHAPNTSTTETPSISINRDVEIRRRYQQPLISEVHDIPTSTLLHDRILPICYQEGLHSGTNNDESCADLVSTGLEVFLKDLLTGIISRTRCNAPVSGPKVDVAVTAQHDPHVANGGLQQQQHIAVGVSFSSGLDRTGVGIMTAGYKRKMRHEELLWAKGEVKRSDAGLLPVEVQSLLELGRGKGAAGDLRLAMEADDTWLRVLAPWQAERLVVDGEYRAGEKRFEEDGDGRRVGDGFGGGTRNGKRQKLTNGVNGQRHDRMEIVDENELGWIGAKASDQKVLGALLDSCLNFE